MNKYGSKAIILLAVFVLFIQVRPVQASEITIVGGQDAERTEYRWQAMLFNPNGVLVCSGTLIDNNWIVTAAHCLDGAGITNITLGGHNAADSSEEGRQSFNVKQVILHPDFSPLTLQNDIGLIELAGSVQLNQYVATIGLVHPHERSLVDTNIKAVVSGWGTMGEASAMSATLQEVTVPLVDQKVCNQNYHGAVQSGMVCAGYAEGGKDACYGDSGGPLIVPDGVGRWKLGGIVSWGRGCARAGYFGVYTDVAYFGEWLQSTLSNLETTPIQTGNGEAVDEDPTDEAQPQSDEFVTFQVFLPMVESESSN